MMDKLEQIEDEMSESMDLMIEAYGLFNQVLKKSNGIDKAMACCLMDSLSKGFKIEVRDKEDKIEQLKENSKQEITISLEEKKRMDRRMEKFIDQSQALQQMMMMTDKALQKYFPLNNRTHAFKKKRSRLRKMRSKIIKD